MFKKGIECLSIRGVSAAGDFAFDLASSPARLRMQVGACLSGQMSWVGAMEGSESGASVIVHVVLAYQARMCKSPAKSATAAQEQIPAVRSAGVFKARPCERNHHSQPYRPTAFCGRRGSSRPAIRLEMMICVACLQLPCWISRKKRRVEPFDLSEPSGRSTQWIPKFSASNSQNSRGPNKPKPRPALHRIHLAHGL